MPMVGRDPEERLITYLGLGRDEKFRGNYQ